MRINDANLLQQVVNYLDKHQEAVRIKKMLYCLCTGRWEKDVDYLNSINFQYLIEQIVRETATLERFRELLQNLIRTVNKPKQYIEIAKVIYLAIGQLYPEFQQQHGGKAAAAPAARYAESTNTSVPSALQRAYAPEATQANNQYEVPSALQRAYAPEPTQAPTNQGVPSAFQRAYAPEPTQAPSNPEVHPAYQQVYEPLPTQQFEAESLTYNNDVDESAYETCYNSEYEHSQFNDEGYAPENYQVEVPEYDPFVLRQNVMSYANPLRAKIILLVMLHPHFNFNTQSLTAMREYHIDDLLLEVLKTYPTISQLEESMTAVVEQLVELEEYGKAANGLIQSLVPLYTKMQAQNN